MNTAKKKIVRPADSMDEHVFLHRDHITDLKTVPPVAFFKYIY